MHADRLAAEQALGKVRAAHAAQRESSLKLTAAILALLYLLALGALLALLYAADPRLSPQHAKCARAAAGDVIEEPVARQPLFSLFA